MMKTPISTIKPQNGQAPPHDIRPKVVYIMGAGRSGSTLLGVALGNCERIFCAGELDAWLRRSGIPNFNGQARAQFWSTVLEDVGGRSDLFGDRPWRYLEHSLAPFLAWRWRTRRQLGQAYRCTTEELYRTVLNAAGTTHIVDTSHYPLRARELQRLSGIDLYLVYLVRDPHNVVASFKRRDINQPSKSVIATNVYLFLTHLHSVPVFLRHRRDRRLFLRYEDFVAAPEKVLPDILKQIDAPTDIPDLSRLTTGIAFQGNRMLRSSTVALRPRAMTRDGNQRVSYLTSVLQRPWSSVFSRLSPTVTATSSRNGHRRQSRIKNRSNMGYINALSLYYLGRRLQRAGVPILPRICEGLIYLLFNSSIPLEAEIGRDSKCGHRGIAVVIHKHARIGERCLIRAQVVIGGSGSPTKTGAAQTAEPETRTAPTIGSDVEIGAGAKIIGPVTIGDRAVIGANAVVLRDVPDDAVAVGIPARIV